ncbi:16S rRNA (cytosine967-C5)-methyltransferase [Limimonas halophila]|uniref:16S rRNA (Cytosine967-C5)-methyltransferase n=1 Tax=Limimonas halophila TaxID=1082479 RepID=A0A1G7LVY0_9PROT|nr:transcription antitermination factor NusB [Limimonas halophila]SDF53655.1 16S rRNA (cytosine967-C5)-methyltransferase [Limimonas halophila]
MSEPESPEPAPGRESRRAALELLRGVLRKHRTLEDAIGHTPRWRNLEARDRAFARHLAATTLRRLGQLDAVIARCLDRPLKPKLAAVQDLLRLGAAQVLFMDTPAHAAVGETVALAVGVRVGAHRNLLNAVLRRIAREGDSLLDGLDAPHLNTPDWLWQGWTAAYGEATARAIAEQHMQEPPLDFTVVEQTDREAWRERLGARELPMGTLRLPPGTRDPRRLPGYDDGAWWVQDAAAGLPPKLLGEVRGKRVVELCAAPGGKTAQLVAQGAEVLAVDRSTERLRQLVDNLNRLSLGAATVAADVTQWQPPEKLENILLDAPCTATGTLRRHPDIARLKQPADVPAMAELQMALLRSAARMLAPGGTLVYAVCSLEPTEGVELVDTLLAEHGDIERVPVDPAEIGGLPEAVTAAGDVRTLPHHLGEQGGLDAFYIARLRRSA